MERGIAIGLKMPRTVRSKHFSWSGRKAKKDTLHTCLTLLKFSIVVMVLRDKES